MAQPTAYNPATNFFAYEITDPNLPGTELDREFGALELTTDEIRANLALIQRDDGELANQSVSYDQLDAVLRAGGLGPLTAWATSTAYKKYQVVVKDFNLYSCAETHTSGAFATDLADAKWTLLSALPAGATGPAAWGAVAAWLTATTYTATAPASVVTEGGETYVCLVSHTSGTFATDYALSKWAKVAQKGADGAGVSGVVSVAEGGTGQTTEAEAIGEMTQALAEDTAPDWSADYVPTYDASADTGKKAKLSTLTRERLQASRSYYVGYVVGNPAISIASPAVVTLTSHGLQANDPVIFSVLENKRACTMTAANPGVFTLTGHGFSAGQPVQFPTTGNLPGGLSQTTTYYVISAGLTANDFEISATVGGAAINTSLLTATFTNGNSSIAISANHNLAVGQIIQFSGTSVVNISNATDYRVKSIPDATHITVSLKSDNTDATVTPGVVTTNGSLAATGSHFCAMVGALPTGVTAGTTYYVLSSGLTANSFQFSTSAGGAAVNTSGSVTGSPVYTLTTGNDSNDGKSLARAGAWLTIQKAINVVSGELDLNTFTATINVAKGTYAGALTLKPLVGRGTAVITGDTTSPSNCVITPTSATCITCAVGGWDMRGFKTVPITAGNHIKGSGGECSLFVRNWEFGAAPSGWYHTTVDANAFIQILSGCTVSGGAQAHWSAQNGGRLQASSQTINLIGVPSFSSAFAEVVRTSSILVPSDTLNGGAAGARYLLTLNAVVDTFGAGSTYLPGNSAGSSATGGQYA